MRKTLSTLEKGNLNLTRNHQRPTLAASPNSIINYIDRIDFNNNPATHKHNAIKTLALGEFARAVFLFSYTPSSSPSIFNARTWILQTHNPHTLSVAANLQQIHWTESENPGVFDSTLWYQKEIIFVFLQTSKSRYGESTPDRMNVRARHDDCAAPGPREYHFGRRHCWLVFFGFSRTRVDDPKL